MNSWHVILAAVAALAIWALIVSMRNRMRLDERLRDAERQIGKEQALNGQRARELELARRDADLRDGKRIAEMDARDSVCTAREAEAQARCERKDREIVTILAEVTAGLPWLARALAQYETLKEFQAAEKLISKPHPAIKAAAQVRQSAEACRQYRRGFHIVRARLDYYEGMFPWLEEYVGLDLDTILEFSRPAVEGAPDEDPVRRYLAVGEYRQLSPVERDQLALDRYLARHKSAWEIGRDYERFIGYGYEQLGYNVEYHGIAEGVADLGRDLIATKDRQTLIIQCKCWAKHKTIHEKHIAQLFGTMMKYRIERGVAGNDSISGVFVTSTILSPMAQSFAEHLQIQVRDVVAMAPYPMIKCNIGRDELQRQSRIYHLPFDQQYDRTKITKEGECYATSVSQAHALGFRRAHQWLGGAAE